MPQHEECNSYYEDFSGDSLFENCRACKILGGDNWNCIGASHKRKDTAQTGGGGQVGGGKGQGGLTREEFGEIMDAKLNPMNRALNLMIESALDPWENIRSIETEAIVAASEPHIDDVCEYYRVPKKHYCMVLGSATHCNIICSHIWPSHTYGRGLTSLDLQAEDVNSPRNFLRLQKDIELAFDHKRLYFEYVDGVAPGPIRLRVVLLDPKIFAENINVNNGKIPFCDVHEKVLDHQFVDDKRPFLRLISLHADKALLKARSMNWIPDEGEVISRRARNVDLARLSLEPNHREVLDAFFGK